VIFINKIFSFILFFIILICIFFIPIFSSANIDTSSTSNQFIFIDTSSEYIWPIPGYTRISSYFGKRKAPTTGAAIYHTGIDIPAPEGTSLFAVCDGEITFTGFLGGGGHTITLTSYNQYVKFTYCHVSPNYIVSKGDKIYKGQLIGHVGPKYIYGVVGNQYFDKNGLPTNGATTGCHLHFGYRIDDKYANPLNLFQNAF
jgi:murein DD-endopeptidase MepM/ murein hydrolase activator NlpD